MSQEEAKEVIAGLVSRYEKVKSAGKLKSYTEEETKKDFILPLFKALGWNVDNKEEVTAEESFSNGRVDYGFYANGWPKFYLEAKKLSADIHNPDFAKQAIRYSWNRGVTWALLTDFESLIVFYAQSASEHLGDKQFFEISYDQYLDQFYRLWWLSRENSEINRLDKEAESVGKKLQKISVTDTLYKDLNECRAMLTKSLKAWNPDVQPELLDEGVQRLLDRLIFIRVAEDRGLEPPTLIPLLRQWQSSNKNQHLYQAMMEKFRELDDIYNSNLFSPHPFEQWEEWDETSEKVINKLYGVEGYYEYDFKVIPADILGNVYENYLGYQLAQSNKQEDTDGKKKKRKEQGIYYTPSFIVDYVTTHALKPILDKCKSAEDLINIKVVDPACGSGSFLIRATEIIYAKYLELGAKPGETTKIAILRNNVFGVDLDEKAVEIARLNLLINALDRRIKLPNLDKNIRNGNTLISGTDKELERAFGKDYRNQNPFQWKEEFPEVFNRDNPGFDVVIGNPPYVNLANIKSEAEREYLKSNYETAKNKSDLYSFFTERAITVLRDGGQLGFIFPNTWLGTDSFSKFRKYMIDNTKVNALVRLYGKIFSSATVTTMLVFLTKQKFTSDYEIKLTEFEDGEFKALDRTLSTKRISESPDYNFSMNPELKFSIPMHKLGTVAKFSLGIKTSNDVMFISKEKKDSNSYPLLRGKDVYRYQYTPTGYWIWYRPDLMMKKTGAGPRKLENFLQNKILFRSITGGTIVATIDKEKYLTNDKVHILYDVEDYDLNAILGIVNSKLIQQWLKSTFNDLLEIKINQLQQIPIPIPDKTTTPIFKELSDTVAKMLDLKNEASKSASGSNKWTSLQSEIEKTDSKIDSLVYKLYRTSVRQETV